MELVAGWPSLLLVTIWLLLLLLVLRRVGVRVVPWSMRVISLLSWPAAVGVLLCLPNWLLRVLLLLLLGRALIIVGHVHRCRISTVSEL